MMFNIGFLFKKVINIKLYVEFLYWYYIVMDNIFFMKDYNIGIIISINNGISIGCICIDVGIFMYWYGMIINL